jgi:hypothetical protein
MTDLQQRVLEAVAREPSLTRAQARRRGGFLLAMAGLASVLVFIWAGGLRPIGPTVCSLGHNVGRSDGDRRRGSPSPCAAGGSMLGRSAPVPIGMALATPVLLVLWKIAVSSAFPGMTVPWPERPGFCCLSLAAATNVGLLGSLARNGPCPSPPQAWRSERPRARLPGCSSTSGARSLTSVISSWGTCFRW